MHNRIRQKTSVSQHSFKLSTNEDTGFHFHQPVIRNAALAAETPRQTAPNHTRKVSDVFLWGFTAAEILSSETRKQYAISSANSSQLAGSGLPEEDAFSLCWENENDTVTWPRGWWRGQSWWVRRVEPTSGSDNRLPSRRQSRHSTGSAGFHSTENRNAYICSPEKRPAGPRLTSSSKEKKFFLPPIFGNMDVGTLEP